MGYNSTIGNTMIKSILFQRTLSLLTLILGVALIVLLGMNSTSTVFANPISSPITPTPTPNPISGPISFTLIIDNTDAGFSSFGGWNLTSAKPGYYGSNYLTDNNKQKGQMTAYWRPNLTGNYKVSVRYVSLPNSAKAVPYTVFDTNGFHQVNKDQRVNGGAWVELGTFHFSATPSNYVQVTNSPKGEVTVDAVRFEAVQ